MYLQLKKLKNLKLGHKLTTSLCFPIFIVYYFLHFTLPSPSLYICVVNL